MRSFVVTHVNVEILDDEELAMYPQRVTIDGIEFAVMRPQTLDDMYKHPFRLLDGDDIVYFVGLSAVEDDFNPLDYYGIDYGCVWIQYKNANDEWEIL